MPPSKWRSANAQHFTLVHRSQQDPLVNDGEASSRVLKSTPRRHEQGIDASSALGQSRHALEKSLGSVAKDERENVGEAASYGIMFDDTEYDYMKHLRAIGGKDNSRRGGKDEEGEEEVIMLEAPKARRGGKERANDNVESMLRESRDDTPATIQLPREVLPSNEMMPRTFEEDKQYGIRPDMDPHLRQVLEALEDDAFLMRTAHSALIEADVSAAVPTAVDEDAAEDEEDIDDFFGEIVSGGAADGDDDEKVAEWRSLPPEGEESIWLDPSARAARELLQLRQEGKGVEDLSLEARVALFKKAAAEQASSRNVGGGAAGSVVAPSSVGSKSIFGEKGASRRSRHAGAKARLAASFYAPSVDGGATAFSMSSSAMERNQGLTHLDEQFARMERIYEQEDDDEEDDEELSEKDDEEEEATPEEINAIFDEFLSKNEIIGKRMHERLGVEYGHDPTTITPLQKVDLIRQSMGEVRTIDKRTLEELLASGLDDRETVEAMISRDLAQRKDARNAWDVETIQTTRTNVENHPRTIAASESVAPSRISRIIPGSSIAGDASAATGSVAGLTDRMAKIKIDPRTGRASVAGYINVGARQARRQQQQQTTAEGASVAEDDFDSPDEAAVPDDQSDADSDDTTTEFNVRSQTVKRDRNESKEEKKARKQAAKEDKQARKAEKASRKQQFKAALHAPTNSSMQGIALR